MTAKSTDERIAELEKSIQSKKAQLKRLRNLEKEKERKARTKRLIEIGGVVEHVLGKPVTADDLPKLQAALEFLEKNKETPSWLSNRIWSEVKK